MINLRLKLSFWQKFRLLFGGKKGVDFSFPNMTFEHGESLIVHSPNSAAQSVAVRIDEHGDIHLMLDPFDRPEEEVIVKRRLLGRPLMEFRLASAAVDDSRKEATN